MVGHVLADVVQARPVLAEMIGEDAGPADRLNQLELDLALPGQRVPEFELGSRPVVHHVLQHVRSEVPGRPRPDTQPVVPGPDGGVQVLDDERDLLERGDEEGGQLGHGRSPR